MQGKKLFGKFLLVLLLLPCGSRAAVESKVVFFEHSLRWADESNFPCYLRLSEVQDHLLATAKEALQVRFSEPSVQMPTDISYRFIENFGKAKIQWPQKRSGGAEIAILSHITRHTTNYRMYWSVTIEVRQSGTISYSRQASHEIVPHSFTAYVTRQRWFGQGEFTALFKQLINEALNAADPLPAVVTVGSDYAAEVIRELLPSHEVLTITIPERPVQSKRVSYEVSYDTVTLKKLEYVEKETELHRGKFNLASAIATEMLAGITGLDLRYSRSVSSTYNGSIEQTGELPWSLRMGTLVRKGNPGLISSEEEFEDAVCGELFQDVAHPITLLYFVRMNTNNQTLTNRNFTLSGKAKGTLGVSDSHIMRGKIANREVEVVLPEQDGIAVLSINGRAVAVLSLFNSNSGSTSFNGLAVHQREGLTLPERKKGTATKNAAEQYALFVDRNADASVDECMRLFISLFFLLGRSQA